MTNKTGGSVVTLAILRRLRSLGVDVPGPDENWSVYSTRAGRHQRSAGAWSWYLDCINRDAPPLQRGWTGIIGGYWPAKMCCKSGATVFIHPGSTDITLDPSDEVIRRELARRR